MTEKSGYARIAFQKHKDAIEDQIRMMFQVTDFELEDDQSK